MHEEKKSENEEDVKRKAHIKNNKTQHKRMKGFLRRKKAEREKEKKERNGGLGGNGRKT